MPVSLRAKDTSSSLRRSLSWRKPIDKYFIALSGKIQTLNDNFKEHHFVKGNEAEEEAMEIEQNLLDKSEDKLFSYMSTLHQLLDSSEPTAAPTLVRDPLQD